ncbi:MAG: diguanylate cyclase [Spirochaetia bacterium]|jgi:diguanylate cyclase (GGDEF)-like protein/PAS domain S-box-containing protein|uniref:diguanylate cyclase n=1 Tax=uncultured Spirochaetota bacterium TaxID=460511 RepID=A0A652ZZZ0_9SPIR|nr:diguanylate cyclase [Spirochaetia bacterium]MCE1208468.1 diguanylate cyclase [Spirochaetia bacterium]NLX45016.1 GGDEF domain-containing protein [Treponema sp.]VBB41217.1 putative signaling protein [uncultured Spirochaetota bacterium]HOI22541.1 diguanylate cyclase [Spirochaetales bacterium]
MVYDESLVQLMSSLDSGVYFVDRNRRIFFWNKAAEFLTGYSGERVIGSSCSENILRHISAEGVELCIQGCPLAGTIIDGRVRRTEVYMHHRNGHRLPVTVWAAPLTDASGQTIGAIEMFTDQGDRGSLLRELEKLRHEALADPLTGLGNRRYLQIVMETRLESVEKGGEAFGLFMADIDHFKKVNDVHGHNIGDRVLTMVATTLGSAVRPLDAAVRWGGEEFILVCPKVPPKALGEIAERLRLLVEHCWLELEDTSLLRVTISLGATRARRGDTLENLVARADACLYRAKNSGRNRWVLDE